MSDMTQRELLLTLSIKLEAIEQRVENISKRLDAMADGSVNQALKIKEIETKLLFYSAGISLVTGSLASIATAIILNLIN